MAKRFLNRSTAVHETLTTEFRESLKDLPKKRVPAFGTVVSRQGASRNPTIQWFKDRGIPLNGLKRI